MSKTKIIIGALMVLGVGMIGNALNVMAERSWDNKTENENVVWENEIKQWDNVIRAWSDKRDSLHKQYYGDKYGHMGTKYCDDAGCWEEGLMSLTFAPRGGLVLEMDKDSCGINGDFTFKDSSMWDCANGGQVLTFKGQNGEFWESSNEGQVIEYKNVRGDFWESSNEGQVIKFKSVAGDEWVSSNHGQVVEYTDKDGHRWSGSDSDTAEDMRWRNN